MERPILFSAPIWRPILEYEGRYEVSNTGLVKSLSTYKGRSPSIMKPWVQNKGYRYVTLRDKKSKKKAFAVHRLVLVAFTGECPKGKQVAHGDGDPSNNNLSNLRWATVMENIADRKRHGRTAIGERNGSSKLDKKSARAIKKLKTSGLSSGDIAHLACIHPSTVESIWKGETWKSV